MNGTARTKSIGYGAVRDVGIDFLEGEQLSYGG